ncbi:hypothetical protein BGZ63DRAFT_370246 [Mariannaea sp. PMI_226]|nr:hypothetical protein BGZ63DRAFT_370246 [Mariannaea sp. PMI_226]
MDYNMEGKLGYFAERERLSASTRRTLSVCLPVCLSACQPVWRLLCQDICWTEISGGLKLDGPVRRETWRHWRH